MACATPRPDAAGASSRSQRNAPVRLDSRRELGTLGERLAVEHLRRRGFRLLDRNARTRHGEIDLVAFDGATLAFVEVKTRRVRSPRASGLACAPLTGLGRGQRARLRRLAAAWLAAGGGAIPRASTLRFDAIGVSVDAEGELLALEHIENAW